MFSTIRLLNSSETVILSKEPGNLDAVINDFSRRYLEGHVLRVWQNRLYLSDHSA